MKHYICKKQHLGFTINKEYRHIKTIGNIMFFVDDTGYVRMMTKELVKETFKLSK